MTGPPSSPLLRPALPLLLLLVALLACGSTSREEGGEAAGEGESPPPVTAQQERAPGSARAAPLAGKAWVVFGADTVVAEVARTADERARGLMYREEVPDGTGMLFVFEEPAIRSFWMENTYIPLDIAFLDPSFRIVDIQQMEPGSTEQHESAAPAILALEVRKGWFAEHGIGVGDVAEIVFGG